MGGKVRRRERNGMETVLGICYEVTEISWMQVTLTNTFAKTIPKDSPERILATRSVQSDKGRGEDSRFKRSYSLYPSVRLRALMGNIA